MNRKRTPPNTFAHGSILSFRDRGPWGTADIVETVPAMCISGFLSTYGLGYLPTLWLGAALRSKWLARWALKPTDSTFISGFNILKDSILDTVGKPSDLVLSHPPYHDTIPYSGSEWAGSAILMTSLDAGARRSSWRSYGWRSSTNARQRRPAVSTASSLGT